MTVAIEIDLGQALGQMSQAASRHTYDKINARVRRFGDSALQEINVRVQQFTPISSGKTHNSIKRTPFIPSFEGKGPVKWTGKVVSQEPQAAVLERGRRPGQPISQEGRRQIYEWVLRQVRHGKMSISGVRTPKVKAGARKVRGRQARERIRFRKSEREIMEDIAFRIAQKITKHGWPTGSGRGRREPYRMFFKGARAAKQEVSKKAALMTKAVAEIVAEAMKEGRKK